MSGQEVQIRLPDEQMQQFLKLRQEDDRLTENLQKVTAQLDRELRNRRTKFITRREVTSYTDSTPIYRSVGKAFVLSSKAETVDSLRNDLGESDQKVLALKQTGIFILGKRDETKNQINDLVKPFIK